MSKISPTRDVTRAFGTWEKLKSEIFILSRNRKFSSTLVVCMFEGGVILEGGRDYIDKQRLVSESQSNNSEIILRLLRVHYKVFSRKVTWSEFMFYHLENRKQVI